MSWPFREGYLLEAGCCLSDYLTVESTKNRGHTIQKEATWRLVF